MSSLLVGPALQCSISWPPAGRAHRPPLAEAAPPQGGVSNVTVVTDERELFAFDTGPGNALLDDFMLCRTGTPVDGDGAMAAAGRVPANFLDAMVADDTALGKFLSRKPPKSCDRDQWRLPRPLADALAQLDTADGAALLTALTARCVGLGLAILPRPPALLVVAGGGRHNPTMLRALRDELVDTEVVVAEEMGWRGDAVEAEAFAYLAVLSVAARPLSFPGTTAVSAPQRGGVRFDPAQPAVRFAPCADVLGTAAGPAVEAAAPRPVDQGFCPEGCECSRAAGCPCVATGIGCHANVDEGRGCGCGLLRAGRTCQNRATPYVYDGRRISVERAATLAAAGVAPADDTSSDEDAVTQPYTRADFLKS